MPPKTKFTKKEMVTAAVEITRQSGVSGLTARSLAAKLGCSVKPIFGLFQNMEHVQKEVIAAAGTLFYEQISQSMEKGDYPPYKASGMAYIGFAREERELFKLLFMRDRCGETIPDENSEIQPLIALIQKNMGLSKEQALRFHAEMWICVHGIATMVATGYLEWDTEFISQTLTDTYLGLKHSFTGK